MARRTEDQEAIAGSIVLIIVTLAAVAAAVLLDNRWASLAAAGLAGIAATLVGLSIPFWWEKEEELAPYSRNLHCEHGSMNTTRDHGGFTYYFCDDCGEQLDAPEMGAHI